MLVSGDVAKTGTMTIETPVSTIGIRGTSVVIQAATEGLRNLITLPADPDGNVGVVEVATLVARVILDVLGASTSVTSAELAPTPVEILTPERIDRTYRAALSAMQIRTGTPLSVRTGDEGDTPDDTQNDGQDDGGLPDAHEAQAFYEAVQELIDRLQNPGVDGEQLTGDEEDALIEQVAAVVVTSPPRPTFITMPDKERPDQAGSFTPVDDTTKGNSGGDDTMTGGQNATYEGFSGGEGDDTIDGGAGFDDAYYWEDPAAISVVLTGDNAFTVTDGYGDTDVLQNIELLTGSRFDDHFDLSSAFSGVIEVNGMEGADTIDGSGGTVDVVYDDAPTGVAVDLGQGLAQDGHGTIDVLHDVENASGSAFDDTLTGSDADNGLEGGGGNDTLVSGLCSDSLVGGDGNDVFRYDSPDDVLHVSVNGGGGAFAFDQVVDFDTGKDMLRFDPMAFDTPGLDPNGMLTDGINFSVIAGSFDGTDAGANNNFGAGQGAFIYSQADRTLYYDNNGSTDGYYAAALVDEPGATDIQGATT